MWIMLRDLVCSRSIRRIVHECMYRYKLWHQYQSILYISTRNKSFTPSVLLSVEPYLCFFAGSVTSQTSFVWELHFVSDPTPQWMFHSLPPLPLLFPFSQQHSALLVCECFFVFLGLIVVSNGCVEWLFPPWWFFDWVSGVLMLGLYCLLRTVVYVPVQYSWCCQVLKVPQYHAGYRTTVSTLFHYFVVRTVLMVMSSTGSCFHSTLEPSVQQCYYCSTPPIQHWHSALYSIVTAHCTVLAVLFSCCHFLAFYRMHLSCCPVGWFFCFLSFISHLLLFVLLFLLGRLWQRVVLGASICFCVLMEFMLLQLACFDWVRKAIWWLESYIWSPARDSHWFE